MAKPDKSRYVWLYLPSKADRERWQAEVDRAGSPLSNFCMSIIEEKLAEEEEFTPRRELARENEALEAENKALHDNMRQKSKFHRAYSRFFR